MKILKFLGVFYFLLCWNCHSTHNLLGYEILSADYSISTDDEFERGYQISMDYKLPTPSFVKYIILNQYRFEVGEVVVRSDGLHRINTYYPIQSKMIQNFSPPETDKRKDGIIFEFNGEEIYQEIKFKLK